LLLFGDIIGSICDFQQYSIFNLSTKNHCNQSNKQWQQVVTTKWPLYFDRKHLLQNLCQTY